MKKKILFDADALNEFEAGIKNYEINLLTSLKKMLPADWKLILVYQSKTKNIPSFLKGERSLQLQSPILSLLRKLWRARKRLSRDGKLGESNSSVVDQDIAQKRGSLFVFFILFVRKVLMYTFSPRILFIKILSTLFPKHYFQVISFSDWFLPGVSKAMIVYDLTNLVRPEVHNRGHSKYIRLLFNDATSEKLSGEVKFLTISDHTRRDFLEEFPRVEEDRVETVYNGIDFRLQDYLKQSASLSTEEILSKYEVKKPFIMGLGTIEPRKNIRTLIRAFEQFSSVHPEYSLVLVGKKGWDEHFEDFMESLSPHVKKSVVITGHIERNDVFMLLQEASLFVYPSLYEGFGLPLLESMALETPAIATGNTSMPEVLGPDGVYLKDPLDFQELNGLMERVLFSKSFDKKKYVEYQRERTKQFDWDNVSKKIIQWIKESEKEDNSSFPI